MLIKFSEIVNKYGRPKGIIHIGAHLMEERNDYKSQGLYNTIWVEANPKVYSNIEFVNNEPNNERVFNYAISDEDNKLYEFNITNNGQSSSILKLNKHKIHHPQIHVSEVINVNSKRMETLLLENNINIDNYDFLNIDIQGAELLALKGFGNLLNNIKYIYTEINTNTLYKDCALVSEIDEYLSKYGFKRVETSMTEFEWGDALYIKINKK
jgi:FkbM family methyltransferase